MVADKEKNRTKNRDGSPIILSITVKSGSIINALFYRSHVTSYMDIHMNERTALSHNCFGVSI